MAFKSQEAGDDAIIVARIAKSPFTTATNCIILTLRRPVARFL